MEISRTYKPILNVEVVLLPSCSMSHVAVENKVHCFMEKISTLYISNSEWKNFENSELHDIVQCITVCDIDLANQDKTMVKISDVQVKYHIYQLNPHQLHFDEFSNADGDNVMPASNQWVLPSADFHGLWESLILDPNIKSKLLNYVSTMMMYSDKKVNSNIIIWNRVVLLHGPPGCAKTSLCRALAQKLCIRFNNRYKYGHFIEVNSHSLFSKWFSESGKLVMKMFQSVKELIQDESGLVILLIDEVESLTRARNSSMAGTEPSDAIRVVNAVLTQIDAICRYPNVLILTTSNLSGAIDLAFVDRADIKQYIGLPTAAAIYQIYTSCLTELMRVGIISPSENLLSLRSLETAAFTNNSATANSTFLNKISKRSVGLSGRTLRKLPLIANAHFIQSGAITLNIYLDFLMQTVERQFEDVEKMGIPI